MKIFECNDELVNILINQGFIENSTTEDQQKGKRMFKLANNPRFYIRFDYKNFEPFEGVTALRGFGSYKTAEEDLRFFIWYTRLPSNERVNLRIQRSFSIETARSFYQSLTSEIDYITRNFKNRSLKRKKRLVNQYQSIELV